MRHKITGQCFAVTQRGRVLLSNRRYGTAGRYASSASAESSKGFHPFKKRRAERNQRAPFFQNKRTCPLLADRIRRAHRVMDPLHGFQNFNQLISEYGQVGCRIIEAKPQGWAFVGRKGPVSVTIITPAFNPAPTTGTRIPAANLPIREIYLQRLKNPVDVLACVQGQNPVRPNKSRKQITV